MCSQLKLLAVPEAVPAARVAITAFCELCELENDVVERVRIAVTEACSNCVAHAYDGDSATSSLLLEARLEDDSLRVAVADYGFGLQVGRLRHTAGFGIGLRLIEQVADATDIHSQPERGTRVSMRFAVSQLRAQRYRLAVPVNA